MPHRPDPDRGRDLERAMSALVLEHGVTALSIRAIAAGVGVAPSTLVHQFTGRQRLLDWFSVVVGKRRTRGLWLGIRHHGIEGLVPYGDQARDDELLWGAVCDLGRTRQVSAEVVQLHDQEQRTVVAYVLRELAEQRGDLDERGRGRAADRSEVELVAALVDGLRTATVRRIDPLPREVATQVLQQAVGRVVGHTPPDELSAS